MSMRAIHARLYPGSLEGDFSIAKSFSDFLNFFINEYGSFIEELADQGGLPNVGEALNDLNQAFSERTGIVLSVQASESDSKPFSTASSATRSVISTIDKLIEAASFLPPYEIRSLKSDLEFLEAQRRDVCDRPAQREQRLHGMSSSIEGLLESLGEGNVGNQPNIEHIRALFEELVESGTYSDEEIQYWFPWRTAQRRGMHLPDDLNGWIMRHVPH